jgi:hypothetical protein
MKQFLGMAVAGALALAATPSQAGRIKQVSFEGHGVVTYAGAGDIAGPPVSVGDTVFVHGTIWLDLLERPETPPPVPSDFTGTVDFTAGITEHATGFAFDAAGGVDTRHEAVPYNFGSVTFVNGRLTGLDLFADLDGETMSLNTYGFGHTVGGYPYSDEPAVWGGRWDLHLATPEPGAWVLMCAGVGLAGTALRHRRGRAAA